MTAQGADNMLVKAFQELPPNQVRNVCIIAHVDHGKTTLADYLVSSNGIISARLAGALRYMDSREDEQTRGITMKSSAISLFYDPLLVNLIDSPGHVDFGSEVNSAINLADIAILVVDVIEGVCSQTESLLRQAINRKLDVILVVNKLDRIITELKMSQSEAFRHLQRLIEHVNSCLSQILQGQLIEEDWNKMEAAENLLHFDPTKGNVIFASAIHGYAFSLDDFSSLWGKKLGIDKHELKKHLFSIDYYFSPKTKSILPEAEAKGKKPLFEQLVLEPLFELHKCALVDKDIEKLKTFVAKLGLTAVRSRRADEAFSELMRQWMPLTDAIIKACCRAKSAVNAFSDESRLLNVCGSSSNPLCKNIRNCDPNDKEMTIVYAAKFFKLDDKRVALCRIMCGTVHKGASLNIIRHGKAKIEEVTISFGKMSFGNQMVKIKQVYIVLGRELIAVESAPAGRICALEAEGGGWISGHVLCSQKLLSDDCQLCFDFSQEAEPLVRVTIQPNVSGGEQMIELRACLKQLSILDSAVRVLEQENGDLALITAGEVHLQKCLKDLSDLGQSDIIVSEPIVPFVETIIPDTQSQTSLTKMLAVQSTECTLRQYSVRIRMRAVPLPDEMVQLLQRNGDVIESLRKGDANCELKSSKFHDDLLTMGKDVLVKMKSTWWMKKSEAEMSSLIERIWSFGPSRAKANIIFNAVEDYDRPSIWDGSSTEKSQRALDRAIVAGFDMAMAQGPLCDEPMQGVAIVVEEWSMSNDDELDENPQQTADRLQLDPQLHGQLISAIRQACKVALKKHPLRLVAAMYKCSVQTSAQALGKVQSVLAQRRAKVISEEINEMSGLFEIGAYMPVVESFSFCEQLRKKTSGMSSAQMQFSHWQLIDEDPYWQPTTEDEIEEFGVKGDSYNQARLYMDAVRKRKGLFTDEMIVVSAEKQRNLKRNK